MKVIERKLDQAQILYLKKMCMDFIFIFLLQASP